jgi:hypothetical protein
MEVIEQKISNFIENQFPAFYKEQGPIFIEFVKQYYKWMEEEHALKHARKIFDYKDIDETTEEFLVYFKEKYLKNIQFQTTTNTRQLLKHTLDLYRSKGTDRAIDLLFKLVFGASADVYYPSKDIFTLSSGNWKRQQYLEVNLNNANKLLTGKSIFGQKSGATAYVDAVVRKNINNRFIDVLYISSIKGNFKISEAILVTPNIFDGDIKKTYITGSLNELDISIIGVGSGYSVGDIVDLKSVYGIGAIGRVTAINNTIGTIDFELIDGGYAYSEDASILISDKIITISNVNVSNTLSNSYLEIFNTVKQPLANINFINARYSNSSPAFFDVNEEIFTYYPNNAVKGYGRILTTTSNTATNAQIFVTVYSGNLQSNVFYTASNTKSANQSVIDGYTDKTVAANVIGISTNIQISIINSNKTFNKNEIVYQVDNLNNVIANATVLSYTSPQGSSDGILNVINAAGVFRRNKVIYNNNSAIANVDSVQIQAGVIDETFSYTTRPYNYFYSNSQYYNTTGVITGVSLGSGASFSIGQLKDTEYINFNTNYLSSFVSTRLNTVYPFIALPTANLSTIIVNALDVVNTEIGTISSITGFNPGQDYTLPPFITLVEPKTYRYGKKDIILNINNSTGNFYVGEKVSQDNNDSLGIVKSANSTTLYVKRLRWKDANSFTITSNSTTRLYGESSGSYANVISVSVDTTTANLGINAIVNDLVQVSNGAITNLEILDSGFGYQQNETVEIIGRNNDSIASAISLLKKQGTAQGYYKQKGGFLSDQKKLYDGLYYQDFSYEIQSSVVLNKYEEILKQVLHMAGSKYFAKYIYTNTANSEVNILETEILVE